PADDELWSAIADPARRRVLDLLARNGEASASWLAGRVPFSRQAVSKHLAVLEPAPLSRRPKQGRGVLHPAAAGRLDPATPEPAASPSALGRRRLRPAGGPGGWPGANGSPKPRPQKPGRGGRPDS